MGVIVDELRRLIERHLQEHGIVAWFDPERHYEAELERIAPSDCQTVRYTGSYFRLREELEPWLRAPERPRLMVLPLMLP